MIQRGDIAHLLIELRSLSANGLSGYFLFFLLALIFLIEPNADPFDTYFLANPWKKQTSL